LYHGDDDYPDCLLYHHFDGYPEFMINKLTRFLNKIIEKADIYGVIIYLEPMPRYKYFRKDIEKRKKISKNYLISYYQKFGFELTPDGIYMKRLAKKPDIRYDDGGQTDTLLAPNGKPSKLTHEQWHLVRTPEFKAWFGDWERAYETGNYDGVSKVIDEETKEPLVVYHGTYIKEKQKNGIYTELNTSTYFTDQKLTAEKYPIGESYVFYNSMIELEDDLGSEVSDYIKDNFQIDESKGIMYSADAENVWENFYYKNLHIYECFIRIIRPKIYFQFDTNEFEFQDLSKDDAIINDFKDDGYDGLIKIYEARWFTEDWFKLNKGIKADYKKEKHFVIFSSNQIKLADGTNTTFDADNPDIRYDDGGQTDTLLAPNGKPSNLTPEQWHLVRTPAFKNWFGDWEFDPKLASKVVDQNGEPKVVWHYSKRLLSEADRFNIFKVDNQLGSHFGSFKQATIRRNFTY
jgi:hypothetical protein